MLQPGYSTVISPVFTPTRLLRFLSTGSADRPEQDLQRILSVVVMAQPPLLPLMFIIGKPERRFVWSRFKQRKQKTRSRFGAQRDEPDGAEKDGDGEMRRDTGLAVGGDRRCLPSYSPFSVVFTTHCRLLPPSFLCLAP